MEGRAALAGGVGTAHGMPPSAMWDTGKLVAAGRSRGESVTRSFFILGQTFHREVCHIEYRAHMVAVGEWHEVTDDDPAPDTHTEYYIASAFHATS